MTSGLSQVTRSIPIVFASVSDPVGDGIRPGGNVTGFTNVEASVGGKWGEILKELAPAVTRMGFLFNPTTAPGGGSYFLRQGGSNARAAARELCSAVVGDVGEQPNLGACPLGETMLIRFPMCYRAEPHSPVARSDRSNGAAAKVALRSNYFHAKSPCSRYRH